MTIGERVKAAVRNWLNIQEPQGVSVSIKQRLNHEAEVFKYRVWWRGEANELAEMYSSLGEVDSFWGAPKTGTSSLRKLHSGLPGMITSVLTDVCIDDLYSIELDKEQSRWDEIAKGNDFDALLKLTVEEVLALGDGAIKLSYDPSFPEPLIMEFYPADKVDFVLYRGRLQEIVFKTVKRIGSHDYTLQEHYSNAGIRYSALNAQGAEIELSTVPDFAALEAREFKAPFMAAVPVLFNRSKKYPGRGASVLYGKLNSLESYDEVVSQWMLAIRRGQLKNYVPEELIPRNPKTGEMMPLSEFDNDFIKTSVDPGMVGNGNATLKIEHTQGTIQSEALLSAYITMLDLCLQGVISPSTLGIDTKKLDNAEAQREKEKTTLYTRNKVLNALNKIIPRIVLAALQFDAEMKGAAMLGNIDIAVSFGGYANPSFEAQVETIVKGRIGGIMSIEASVDELYGDTKDDEWKKKEVARLKAEAGYTDMPEPAVNSDGVIDDGEPT